jgi:uncharacterized protein (TIGR02145 family)
MKLTTQAAHTNYTIWIIVLLFFLQCGCEYDSSPKNDYTGQLDSITDIDGNQYKTIGIGTQIWMQENLKVSHLNDGTEITLFPNINDWRNKNLNIAAFCWYDNDSINNKSIYGGLYNFFAVETGLLCPTGWHVPNQTEWKTLVDFLGGKEIAGGKLKEHNGNYWIQPYSYILNSYKFGGLPSGSRFPEAGGLQRLGYSSWWWENKISSADPSEALILYIDKDVNYISEKFEYKNGGASVRCVKDE